MTYPFAALKPEYTALLSQMAITRASEVHATAERLISYIDAGHYKAGCDATGVPQAWAAASFEREASSNFRLSPAQGDPWNERSVHVPRGEGPFHSFTEAQERAYEIDGLDKVGAGNWSWERACYEGELFNGFGYRAYGVHSPYLWAGSNIYGSGKYVADGKFSRSAVDTQLGIVPMMYRMVQLRPDLALPFPFPGKLPAPQPAPDGLQDAETLQKDLNALGADPKLVVDGNYGRNTKRAVAAFQKVNGLDADGIAGPQTWDAINRAMKGKTP